MSHRFRSNDLPGERTATELLLNVVDALSLESDFGRFFSRAADAARRLVGGDGAAVILLNLADRFEYQFFNGLRLADQSSRLESQQLRVAWAASDQVDMAAAAVRARIG